jgi:hypothetical protein
MTKACADSGTVWTCGLTLANALQALAVWNTAGNSGYSPAAQYTTYGDLGGRTNSVIGPVTIGIQPILLQGTAVAAAPPPPPPPPTNLTAVAH